MPATIAVSTTIAIAPSESLNRIPPTTMMAEAIAAAMFALRKLIFISRNIANDYVYKTPNQARDPDEVAAFDDTCLDQRPRPV